MESSRADGRAEQALDDTDLHVLEAALDDDPENAELHCKLGHANLRAGHLDDAADCFTLALHHRPGMIDAHLGLGSVLMQGERWQEALTCYRAGLEHHPKSAELRTNLGLALFELGQSDTALAECERSTREAGGLGEAWHNLGYVLLYLDRAQEALACFERALAAGTAGPATQACRGHALRDLGKIEAAIEVYDMVLATDPGFADAITNRGFANLLLGRYQEGWRDYAWRFGEPGPAPRGFPFQPWRGESLEGRSILVYAEQGIGDEILFSSCLPDVVAAASRCIIECNTRLAGMYARAFPSAIVHGGQKTDLQDWLHGLGAVDFQAPIGDLPRYLRPSRESFPRRHAYLTAEALAVERWRSRLRELGPGPYSGLCWRGGSVRTRARARSVALSMLAPALEGVPGQWVSLQRGTPSSDERVTLQRLRVSLTDQGVLDDIDDLAALITALDLVVSIDSTIVHLAGALGRPVWALLPFCPEWRYGMSGDAMVWYASVELLRQPAPSAWEPVIQSLTQRLRSESAR